MLLNAKTDHMQNAMEMQVSSKIDSLCGLLEKLVSERQEILKKELEKGQVGTSIKKLRHRYCLVFCQSKI